MLWAGLALGPAGLGPETFFGSPPMGRPRPRSPPPPYPDGRRGGRPRTHPIRGAAPCRGPRPTCWRRPAAVPPRRAGGPVDRRRGCDPRLPRPAGADGRGLPPRPLRRPARRRLYRTGDRARWLRRRPARVPGPGRRPGEDPRLPRRAGGDRVGPRPPPRRGRPSRSCATTSATRTAPRLVAYVVPGARGRTGAETPDGLTPGLAPTSGDPPRAHGALRASSTWSASPSPPAARWTAAPCRAPRRGAAPEREYVAPRDGVEEALAAIWRRLLGVERVGVHDNFFELGGHSLLGTRVIVGPARGLRRRDPPARPVREAHRGRPRPGRDPGAPGGSGQLRARRPPGEPRRLSDEEVEALLAAGEEEEEREALTDLAARLAGLSPKRRELLLRQLGEGARARLGPYPQAAARRLPVPGLRLPASRVDPRPAPARHRRLQRAGCRPRHRPPGPNPHGEPAGDRPPPRVAAHHLRRGVGRRARAGRCPRSPPGRAPCRPLGPAESLPEAGWKRLLRHELAAPFDLARGPLLRALLSAWAERDHLLLFTMHHIVSDGWSMGIFFRELSASTRLRGRPRRSPSCPSSTPTTPSGSARPGRARCWSGSSVTGASQLAGVGRPASCLPTGRGPRAPALRGGASTPGLPRRVADGPARARARGRATPFMVLLAASTLLARHSGQDDLVRRHAGRGTAAAPRLEGADRLLRQHPGAAHAASTVDPASRDLSDRVRDGHAGALPTRTSRSSGWSRSCSRERDLSRTPLFQALLALQNFPAPEVAVAADCG